MNRTIKFRGRDICTGKFVFGDLAHTEVGVLIGAHEVQPESVAQLVGFDADDREVYEGDKIFHTMSNHESFAEYGDNPAYLKLTKLKEVTK